MVGIGLVVLKACHLLDCPLAAQPDLNTTSCCLRPAHCGCHLLQKTPVMITQTTSWMWFSTPAVHMDQTSRAVGKCSASIRFPFVSLILTAIRNPRVTAFGCRQFFSPRNTCLTHRNAFSLLVLAQNVAVVHSIIKI